MLRDAGPHGMGSTFEFQRYETLVSEHAVDRCDKWPERETIAGREWRWRWTVFGAHLPIAGAKHHRPEPEVLARERGTTGKARLDRRAARPVNAVQACGQRGRIVGDDEIAGLQKIRQ